ncbi:MAG: hypothetical protein V1790_17655 [Planctomycetota bacterium]
MADLRSRPYNPDPAMACEKCVFGTGEHAEWCSKRSAHCSFHPYHCPFCGSKPDMNKSRYPGDGSWYFNCYFGHTWIQDELPPPKVITDQPLTDVQLDRWVEQWVEP